MKAEQQVCKLVPTLVPKEVRHANCPCCSDAADCIIALIKRLLTRRAMIQEGATSNPLTAHMIGVVCAHVSQVNAVRERLPGALFDVFVETSDRFQGLERPLMFVYHPLSGRADASEFHLDAGRLWVMMSRRRVACWLVARAGIDKQMRRYAPSGDRILGLSDDTEYEGWRAHMSIMNALRASGRIISIP